MPESKFNKKPDLYVYLTGNIKKYITEKKKLL